MALTNTRAEWIATLVIRPDAVKRLEAMRELDPPIADLAISLAHLLQNPPPSSELSGRLPGRPSAADVSL